MSASTDSESPDLGEGLLSRFGGEETDAAEDGRARMSFLDHLDELRRRVIYSVYAVLGGCLIAFFYLKRIEDAVMGPLQALIPNGAKFIYTQPMEYFIFKMKAGLLVGVMLASPVVLLQVWYFIAPGLYSKEKKLAVPFVTASTGLFLTGAWFAHQFAFRWTWRFLASMTNQYVQFMPKLEETFSLYLMVVLGFGVVFQMPVVVFVLARFGLVTARFLITKGKYAILLIFILAAVLSPGPDVVSQLLFAAPMLVLYAISIVVAWLFAKKKKKAGSI